MIRKTVHFAGRVQGVGFRATSRMLSESFDVTGYVRNLNDGRVELVVEGERNEIGSFLDAIDDRMGILIESVDTSETLTNGEYDSFEVRY